MNLAMPFVIINFALADLVGVGSSVPIAVSSGARPESARRTTSSPAACVMHHSALPSHGLRRALLYALAPCAYERLMGAEGEFAEPRSAVSARLCPHAHRSRRIIFAVDNYLRICGYIRGSMVAEHNHVGAERRICILLPGRVQLRHMGRGPGHLLRECSCARLVAFVTVLQGHDRCCVSAGRDSA